MDQSMPLPPGMKKERKGLFGSDKPQLQQDMSSFIEDVGNIGRRLRITEESFTNLRRQLQLTEKNMIDKNRLFSTEIRTIMSDVSETKKELNEVKEKIVELVKELKDSAKREDVKVLEKYINMWNPVKFVTQNEVDQMIKDILNREKGK